MFSMGIFNRNNRIDYQKINWANALDAKEEEKDEVIIPLLIRGGSIVPIMKAWKEINSAK